MACATEKQRDIMDELHDGLVLLNDDSGWSLVGSVDLAFVRRADGRAVVGLLARGVVVLKRAVSWGFVYGLAEELP